MDSRIQIVKDNMAIVVPSETTVVGEGIYNFHHIRHASFNHTVTIVMTASCFTFISNSLFLAVVITACCWKSYSLFPAAVITTSCFTFNWKSYSLFQAIEMTASCFTFH